MRSRWIAIAAVAAGGVALLIAGRNADRGAYTVRAEFADAAGLRGHSQVKVGGVVVGSVESLAITPHNSALVTMRLSSTRVGPGARASIRPVNLLGEKYVDLTPGDHERAFRSGVLIPRSRTATPVELDQLLDTLDASTRVRLQILIDESGEALAGRGANFGATLAALPPALDQARAMVGSFAQDNRALGRLVVDSDGVIGAMAGQRRALGALVGTTSDALGAVAGRDRQLGQSIAEAAPAITQMRTTLARLQTTATALAPAARGLRASAPGLASTLHALPSFAQAATPTLRTARTVAPSLSRLGVKATPVVSRLRPVAQRLDEFAQYFDPVSTTFDKGIGNLLGFIEGWARAIQVGDGASHMFRNQLVMSPEIAQRLLAGYLRPASRRRDRHRHVVTTPRLPAVTVPHTRLPNVPKPTLPAPRLVQQLTQTLDDAPTADQQVSQLLDYLMGK